MAMRAAVGAQAGRRRIAEDIKPAGLDWITALRAPAIRGLLDGGAFQMSLFDDRDMAAITSPDFPHERLIVCRNHALAAERARKREDLLQATERDLARIATAVRRKRQPLAGKAEIGMAVGAGSASTTWPSTSPSRSPTPPSPSPARRRRSLPRRPSMASTPCAPACPPRPSTTAPH